MSVHSALTGVDLHESKGVASASVNTVAVATGTGTTNWTLVTKSSLDPATIKGVGVVYFCGSVPNISTAGTSVCVPIPVNCTITSIEYTLGGTIATGNGLMLLVNPGVATIASTTIPYSGSTFGQCFTTAVAGGGAVTAGNYVFVETNGTSANAVPIYFTITATLT